MPIRGNGNHLIGLFFDVARDAFSFISDDEGDFSLFVFHLWEYRSYPFQGPSLQP